MAHRILHAVQAPQDISTNYTVAGATVNSNLNTLNKYAGKLFKLTSAIHKASSRVYRVQLVVQASNPPSRTL